MSNLHPAFHQALAPFIPCRVTLEEIDHDRARSRRQEAEAAAHEARIEQAKEDFTTSTGYHEMMTEWTADQGTTLVDKVFTAILCDDGKKARRLILEMMEEAAESYIEHEYSRFA
jgi:hypothetical protein